MALVLIGTSSILGAINFLVTIFKMRAPGMTLFRMPILVWTVLVTSVLVLMATPVITSALIMLFIDRNYGGVVLRPARRRRRDPVPEHLLVLLASGGLRHDPAGDGHGQRDPAGLLAQAAVRLQGVRLRHGRDRRPGLLGVGPPHVHDRRGLPAVLQHHDLPDRGPDRGQDVQLGVHDVARAADAQDAAPVRHRLPVDVPDRRHQRRVQRVGAGRLRPPRHVLGGRPPALRAVRRLGLRGHGRASTTGSRR